jgi:transcriptional regulator with XRE-family HTH domain
MRRKELGLTQQALANRLGVHKQFVSRYELGERRLDIVEFVDIARALDLQPGELATDVPPDRGG